MPTFCPRGWVPPIPRAGLDPIDGAGRALAALTVAMSAPRRDETVVLLLDRERCGLGLLVVAGTVTGDRVVGVLESIVRARDHHPQLAALVVMSVRTAGGIEPDDVDRWLEMSDLAAAGALELVEWFVVDDWVNCPRDLLGEPPRW